MNRSVHRKLKRPHEEALKNHSPKLVYELGERIIERAEEYGLRSIMAVPGLYSEKEIKLFSHEWPFGVGYCTALREFSQKQPAPVQLARETIKRLLENSPLPDSENASTMRQEHKSCFVSITTKDGELRGCIGTLSPVQES